MEDEPPTIEDKVALSEEDNRKKEPKKGISVTRALVMLGFDDWKDLEPSKYTF